MHSINPNPNFDTASILNISFYDHESLTIQPFTSFTGGLVINGNQHTLNITNEGGNFCMFSVELVVGRNTNYIHQAGHLNFENINACVQVKDGGRIIVPENAYLGLGEADGVGMLNLRQDGSFIIKEGGEIHINNMLLLSESPGITSSQQVYMELNPGSTLSFGPDAMITNKYSIDEAMKLNIYMNGGILDDRLLDAKSKSLINKIYPTIEEEDLLEVFPNPANHTLTLKDLDPTLEKTYTIFSLHGKLISKGLVSYNELNIANLDNGMYVLQVKMEGKIFKSKFLKTAN
ncbi:MAG: T9SS type A sorting domain-containing protein [Bacteroidota bacterium]